MGLKQRLVARVPEPTLRRLQRLRHHEPTDLDRMPTRKPPRNDAPITVTDFDAHAVRRHNSDAVATALDTRGVPFVALPAPHGQVRQIAVAAEHHAAAADALATLDGSVEQSGSTARYHRPLTAPNGTLLGGPELGCEVAFWSGGTDCTYRAPNRTGVTDALSRAVWDAATGSSTHWIESRPSALEVTEPIDIVYTWVDGDDPEWQARRAAHVPGAELHASATHAARFTSRDELRYSLRSVAMYARWVRRIFVVTDAQVPGWLDVDHRQVEVVDHKAIFRDPSVLPVFNSHAIESQLHHIDGLAERYLYLNDDVFLGRPVEPELFFHSNGLGHFYLSSDALDADPIDARDLPAVAAAKNNRTLLQPDFGRAIGRKFQHGVHPQQRPVLAELEQRYPDAFARVAASRFRHPDDIAVASGLGHWYAYLTGRAVPGSVRYLYQDIARADAPRRLDAILRQRPQVFCINEVDAADTPAHRALLRAFFDAYFPLPSPYERSTHSEQESGAGTPRR